jgi:hypothetical protein
MTLVDAGGVLKLAGEVPKVEYGSHEKPWPTTAAGSLGP